MLFSNVNEDEFEIINEFKKSNVVYIEVKLKNRGCRCRNCGTFHTNVKEYKLKKIVHSIYAYQSCVVLFRQRRFVCPKCNKTHMEVNPFKSDINKVSDCTVENVLKDIKRYNNTFTAIGERYHMSTRGVMKLFDRYCQMDRLALPKVLCIDEVYFSRKRNKKYILILINFFNGAIVDVLKDRDKHTISSYFRNIPKWEIDRIEYVSIDMNEHYRDVLSYRLPKATIIVDSFHVVKRVSKALDDIRKKVMRRFEENKKSDEYYLLKYRNELLFKMHISREFKYNNHYRIIMSEYELLRNMLDIDDELNDAYNMYQLYLYFNEGKQKDLNQVRNDLNNIINEYKLSGIEEFYNLAHTLENWKEEIIASFITIDGKRISNGPIEGRNAMIKKILKLANGYSNFYRFRNRIIYSLNKLSKHSFKRQ